MKVSMAIDTMAKRATVLGDSYPFVVSDIAVLRRTSHHAAEYATLLFLTPGSVARQTVRASETAVMGELLEEISEAALANFWGPGGSALSFGYPSKHGRPESFDQAVIWLAGKMGLEAGRGYRPPRRKDGGVDVVAWRQLTTVVMVIDRIRLMDLLARGTDETRDISWVAETAAALKAVLKAGEL
jgi:hypothetical protein